MFAIRAVRFVYFRKGCSMKVFSSKNFMISAFQFEVVIMSDIVTQVCSGLHLSMGVSPRHLPYHTRFTTQISVVNGAVVRIRNPTSLTRLCAALVVANAEPSDVQRSVLTLSVKYGIRLVIFDLFDQYLF
jgi:hypothetical protein